MAESPKTVDAYEYVAVIAPGAIATLGLVAAMPQLKAYLGDKLSLGEFGIFLVVSFAVGHVVQAGGNLWEWLIWLALGKPTDRVLRKRQRLLSEEQRNLLEAKLSEMECRAVKLDHLTVGQWRLLVARLAGRLSAAGASDRVDTFNRTYGLLRGLSVAFLSLGVWLLVTHGDFRAAVAAVLFGAALTVRMLRVSVHYARALLLRFIDLAAPAPPAP